MVQKGKGGCEPHWLETVEAVGSRRIDLWLRVEPLMKTVETVETVAAWACVEPVKSIGGGSRNWFPGHHKASKAELFTVELAGDSTRPDDAFRHSSCCRKRSDLRGY